MPRVLIARFMHETNTFSRVKTDMALIPSLLRNRSRMRIRSEANLPANRVDQKMAPLQQLEGWRPMRISSRYVRADEKA